MKTLFFTLLFLSMTAKATDFQNVKQLALKNGLKPSNRVIKAVVTAARWYQLNPLELAAIGIIETGLGKYNVDVINKNGTVDTGLFQINTINTSKCPEFNLNTPEGSSMCAARLLQRIRRQYQNVDESWPAIYHSKTKKHKEQYFQKLSKVLAKIEATK